MRLAKKITTESHRKTPFNFIQNIRLFLSELSVSMAKKVNMKKTFIPVYYIELLI